MQVVRMRRRLVPWAGSKDGGPDRDRTGDLLNAIQARSQLRYRPISGDRTPDRSARPGGPQPRQKSRSAVAAAAASALRPFACLAITAAARAAARGPA